MSWTGAHQAFTVKMVFKIGECVIAAQRAFHAHFMLHLNDTVPERKSILL